jgi:uncharacterized protein YwbE
MQYMKVGNLIDFKECRDDGTIVQMVVWQLPQADDERPHGLKYRLYCGRAGHCLVRYDNETGKGDHRHYGEHEEPYTFTTLTALLEDFQVDVERLTQ